MKILAIVADITELSVDVIVNAANPYLMDGGGVDAAIHRNAGPNLTEACRALNGCDVGDANLTLGYELKAKNIIHAVGPRWRDGKHDEVALLASCYRRSIQIAESIYATSIAFPSISTGIYRFPIELAAGIAVQTLLSSISEPS